MRAARCSWFAATTRGQGTSDLVLTDQDFGEFYLRRRVVPDFIYDAARLYHLVLVGYSASDAPMRYLLNAEATDVNVGPADDSWLPGRRGRRESRALYHRVGGSGALRPTPPNPQQAPRTRRSIACPKQGPYTMGPASLGSSNGSLVACGEASRGVNFNGDCGSGSARMVRAVSPSVDIALVVEQFDPSAETALLG